MNELITQTEAACHVEWWFALWIFLVAVWYLVPVVFHIIGWSLAWIDDSKYKPKWTPWFGLWKLTQDKKYDIDSYYWHDHEMKSLFFGWAGMGVVVAAIYFWQAALAVGAILAVAFTARFTKRLSKKFAAHEADKNAHN